MTKKQEQRDAIRKRRRLCVICGKILPRMENDHLVTTCSRSCRSELLRRTRQKKYSDLIKTCDFCGVEFRPRTTRQRFCSELCGKRAYTQRRHAKHDDVVPVIWKYEQKPKGYHDAMSVAEVREYFGLPAIESGYVECLKCRKQFKSPDVKNVRMCDECKSSLEEIQDWGTTRL